MFKLTPINYYQKNIHNLFGPKDNRIEGLLELESNLVYACVQVFN